MRVIIVGLPLFAERLRDELSAFDESATYIHLNTYYRKWDKLKAWFLIPGADIVYSINGTLSSSGVFDRALKLGKKVVMHWVGTDVLSAKKAVKENTALDFYRKKAIHFCEVDWIQDELLEIGVKAEKVNIAVFEKEYELRNPSGSFCVLTYIPPNRSDFYGLNELRQLAFSFPKINFIIAGTSPGIFENLPENVELLGWVKDMNPVFDRAHVCLRYPEHDGLSFFVLEALARGKQVMYRYSFPHCHSADSIEELRKILASLVKRFDEGDSLINSEGAQLVINEYNRKKVLSTLSNRLKEVYAN